MKTIRINEKIDGLNVNMMADIDEININVWHLFINMQQFELTHLEVLNHPLLAVIKERLGIPVERKFSKSTTNYFVS